MSYWLGADEMGVGVDGQVGQCMGRCMGDAWDDDVGMMCWGGGGYKCLDNGGEGGP